jgi:hypothetical protein
MLLRLQLAPDAGATDKQFEAEIESVFREFESLPPVETEMRLEFLVKAGQGFLWKEWRKVKDETLYGDPYDTIPRRLERWLAGLER